MVFFKKYELDLFKRQGLERKIGIICNTAKDLQRGNKCQCDGCDNDCDQFFQTNQDGEKIMLPCYRIICVECFQANKTPIRHTSNAPSRNTSSRRTPPSRHTPSSRRTAPTHVEEMKVDAQPISEVDQFIKQYDLDDSIAKEFKRQKITKISQILRIKKKHLADFEREFPFHTEEFFVAKAKLITSTQDNAKANVGDTQPVSPTTESPTLVPSAVSAKPTTVSAKPTTVSAKKEKPKPDYDDSESKTDKSQSEKSRKTLPYRKPNSKKAFPNQIDEAVQMAQEMSVSQSESKIDGQTSNAGC